MTSFITVLIVVIVCLWGGGVFIIIFIGGDINDPLIAKGSLGISRGGGVPFHVSILRNGHFPYHQNKETCP